MLRGPNFKSLEKILTNIKGIDLIAAGGVSSLNDIQRLKEYENDGLQGCVIGKAIYDGRIDLIDAIKIAIQMLSIPRSMREITMVTAVSPNNTHNTAPSLG